MEIAKQPKLKRFEIETATKIFCLNAKCVNLVPEDCCCNLKRLVINAGGKCAGFVKMAEEKKTALPKAPKKKTDKK